MTMLFIFINFVFRSSETQWSILNDSLVEEGVGWDQFVTRTSHSDTPYLLLYHRLGQENTEERLPAADKLARVIADNMLVEREILEDRREAEEKNDTERRMAEEARQERSGLKRMANNLDEFDAGMSPPKRPK